jgi:hypothetical protein
MFILHKIRIIHFLTDIFSQILILVSVYYLMLRNIMSLKTTLLCTICFVFERTHTNIYKKYCVEMSVLYRVVQNKLDDVKKQQTKGN